MLQCLDHAIFVIAGGDVISLVFDNILTIGDCNAGAGKIKHIQIIMFVAKSDHVCWMQAQMLGQLC